MKIVEVCPYDMQRPGGVQAHIRDLAAWLETQGHEVMIIAPPAANNGGNPGVRVLGSAREINFQGTRFEICRANGREMDVLADELRDWGADVLHLHTPWTPMLPWQVWRKTGLPALATFHATLPEDRKSSLANRLLYRVAGFFMARMGAVIVPSVSPLRQLEKIRAAQVLQVLPPSVDLSPWRDAAQGIEKSGDAAVNLLFLGRLEARKGVEVLLAAWGEIAEALPDATLTIAGNGALEPQVLAHIAAAGDGRLRYVPAPDPEAARALMAQADIFVAPSIYGESFGIVLIEAMAAQAVPVAAANSGYATVLTDQGADLLVPPKDVRALAAKIIALANDPVGREKLRQWGAAHAVRFDIASTGPQFEAVFRDIAGKCPAD